MARRMCVVMCRNAGKKAINRVSRPPPIIFVLKCLQSQHKSFLVVAVAWGDADLCDCDVCLRHTASLPREQQYFITSRIWAKSRKGFEQNRVKYINLFRDYEPEGTYYVLLSALLQSSVSFRYEERRASFRKHKFSNSFLSNLGAI